MTSPQPPPGIGSDPPYGAPLDPATAAELAALLECQRCRTPTLLRLDGLCLACRADDADSGADSDADSGAGGHDGWADRPGPDVE